MKNFTFNKSLAFLFLISSFCYGQSAPNNNNSVTVEKNNTPNKEILKIAYQEVASAKAKAAAYNQRARRLAEVSKNTDTNDKTEAKNAKIKAEKAKLEAEKASAEAAVLDAKLKRLAQK